jgi:hypothetical protein
MFICGIFGGALPEIIRIIRSRYTRGYPNYYKRFKYWLGTIFLLILGGLAAWLFMAHDVQSAIAFGYGAPELFSRIVASTEGPDRSGEESFSIRKWWTL